MIQLFSVDCSVDYLPGTLELHGDRGVRAFKIKIFVDKTTLCSPFLRRYFDIYTILRTDWICEY